MRANRPLKLALLALSTVLLAAGVWAARDGLQQLTRERGRVAQAQARLDAAQRILPGLQQRERFAAQIAEVQAQARSAGFEPSQWAQRRIQRSPVPASRRDVQDQLAQLGTAEGGRLMAADSFELAVLSRDAGLFTPPALDDKGLMLSLNGTLYFPLATTP